MSVVSRSKKRDHSSDSDSEASPSIGGMQSKVELVTRDSKRSRTSNAPNSSLILRAVADANKSVGSAKRALASDAGVEKEEGLKKKKKAKIEGKGYSEREEKAAKTKAAMTNMSITVSNLNASKALLSREHKPSKRVRKISEDYEDPSMDQENKDEVLVEEYFEEVEEYEEEEDMESLGSNRAISAAELMPPSIDMTLDEIAAQQQHPKAEKKYNAR